MPSQTTERHVLATMFDNLEGKRLVVPSLKTIDPGWPVERHPDYEKLDRELREWSRRWWKDVKVHKMLEALNPALWTSLSYSNIPYEKLLCICKFLAWVFVWDDIIDEGESGYDDEALSKFENESLDFIAQCFNSGIGAESLTNPNPTIESIKDFAIEIRDTAHPDTCRHFYEELNDWVLSVIESRKERAESEVPRLDSYLKRRSVNAGVYLFIPLIEYGASITIPEKLWKTNKSMRTIWHEAAVLILISNDMGSLPKELRAGQFESWIPLIMYHNGLSIQDAMNSACQLVITASKRIVETEARLLQDVDLEYHSALETLIGGIKNIVVCCLHHGYTAKRYIKHGEIQDDGSIAYSLQIKVN